MKLLSLLFLAIVAFGKNNVTEFPEGMFGKWIPTQVPQAIMGPLAFEMLNYHDGGFSALRHHKTGDVWFTMLWGQVFHVSNTTMQYCFGNAGVLAEQSPFEVHAVSDTVITFCWHRTMRRLPTHADGCSGCDCARIQLILTGKDTMQFTFWQSPPVVHAHLVLKRKGGEPTFAAIESTMVNPYKQCAFRDKWGPNLPNVAKKLGPPGCARGLLEMAMKNEKLAHLITKAQEGPSEAPKAGEGKCHKLNGFNHEANLARPDHHYRIPDVRLQFKQPKLPCSPCNVSYSISADVAEDEYISVGFKGQSWEAMFPKPPEHPMRPCYFGMCVDEYDNFTNDRITLGYASTTHGSCVREMYTTDIVGEPYDVDYKLVSKESVKRRGGRTIVSFTTAQSWPTKKAFDGWFRVMWAVGKVDGARKAGCDADIAYHGVLRGLAPINWLIALGSMPCEFDAEEFEP